MSWKTEVYVDEEWCGNALVFETELEAKLYGADLLSRWFVPTDYRAVETDAEVNYKIENNQLIRLDK